MKPINWGDLKERLSKIVEVREVNVDQYGFTREIQFTVEEVTYTVVWFVNVSTLKFGSFQFFFTDLEISGTWPNGYKTNIQFVEHITDSFNHARRPKTTAVIGVVKYDPV